MLIAHDEASPAIKTTSIAWVSACATTQHGDDDAASSSPFTPRTIRRPFDSLQAPSARNKRGRGSRGNARFSRNKKCRQKPLSSWFTLEPKRIKELRCLWLLLLVPTDYFPGIYKLYARISQGELKSRFNDFPESIVYVYVRA